MGPELRFLVLVALGVAIGVLAAAMAPPAPAQAAIEWLAAPRPVGAFELQDATGSWRSPDLHGEWTVVVLGFTHCPDVCPTSLAELARLARTMGRHTPRVAFVSVDPARDSPIEATRYARAFHPGFRGATGSSEQLRRFTRALGMQFEAAGETVAHSTAFAVIDPTGAYVGRFRPGFEPSQVARELQRAVDAAGAGGQPHDAPTAFSG
jgi:protein SCO1/2